MTLLFAIPTFAQRSAEKRAQIEELRAKYIQERLELTEEEQTAFDEVQADYRKKMSALRSGQEESAREMRAERRERQKEEYGLTEAQAKDMLMKKLDREEAKTQMDKSYTLAMIEAIGARKTVDYKRLEREFKRELIHMVKDRRENHQMKDELKYRKDKEAEAKPISD